MGGSISIRCRLVCLSLLIPVLGVVLAGAHPAGAGRLHAVGTRLPVAGAGLRGPFPAASCPQGAAQSARCFALAATGAVPGLGTAKQSGVLEIDAPDTACATFQSEPVLTVAGKGTIELSTHTPAGKCINESAANGQVDGTEQLIVTGGTGDYAGASGSGTFKVTAHVFGNQLDTIKATIVARSANFDLTPPVISGASAKLVRLPKGHSRVRIRYSVKAQDAVDGPVHTVCKPASGSLFKIGRTRVTCTATDTSANMSTARFTVTVKE